MTGPAPPDESAEHVGALLPPPWEALAPGGRATHRRAIGERPALAP